MNIEKSGIMNIVGLGLTLLTGVFILIGALIVFISNNNQKITMISISMALGVIISLLFFELIPESLELMGNTHPAYIKYVCIILFAIAGFLILKVLDMFVPHHHDHSHPDNDKLANMFHIGLVSSIALIIHNIIEGMAIYSTALASTSLGVLVCLGVGMHNIPLGMVITSTIYKSNNNKGKTMLIILLIALSTFFGGLLISLVNPSLITDLIKCIMLSITLGMLVYIALFELLPPIIHGKQKWLSAIFIVVGIMIFGLSLLFHHH